MVDHWQQFADDVPWFLQETLVREVREAPRGSWRPRSSEFSRLFPDLTRLLASSFVTHVETADRSYVLHSWDAEDGYARSWLCAPPHDRAPQVVYSAHGVLLESFGGVVERSNELTDSWLLNHNEVLTAEEAKHDATFIEAYGWAFADFPAGIPIDLRAYYSIAREANGNTTLCHRITGEVLLFAPDHSFDHIVPLEGCPEYSLYRIPTALTFEAWVEAVARQWTVV
jgi:hypothetical protein